MIRVHETEEIEHPSLEMFPSEFVGSFVNMATGGELNKFSFKGREYLLPIYDTPARRALLLCGRQVEKSTTLGNIVLTYTMLRQHFRALFVSPTQQQTETFSRDRIATPIEMSPHMQVFSRGESTKNNVLYKKFITGSDLTLRYAFLHADRVRGISADMLLLDEIQDVLTEVIPVIEEALAHSPLKILRYSGTPKSIDNTISYYWNQFSTQNEWVIPCDGCNTWNKIGIDNIGTKFLMCTKCGKQIHPNHEKAQWASMRSKAWLRNPPINEPFEGYRIPQVITPWVNWFEITDKRKRYSRAQFYNEVLGLPFDSGSKPLTKETLIANCTDRSMADAIKFKGRGNKIFMGVDWGTAENSYTVMTIGCYIKDKFAILLMKRFEGEEAEPERVVSTISSYIDRFNVAMIGVDYGGGFDRNDKLIRTFGLRRVARYQYVNTRKIYFDKSLSRFMVNRTEALMAIINAFNRKDTFALPKWEEIEHPHGSDMLSVFTEYNESRRTTVVQRTPGTTDDTLHSLTYCFLASMMQHPRPDIIAPIGDKEDKEMRKRSYR